MYIIISGYYVTKRLCSELPAGCLSCFICWLRFLVFNQNFLFLLLLHSLNSGQPTSVSVKTKRKQFGGVAMTHTHTHTHTHSRDLSSVFVSISSATGNGKVAPLQFSHPPKKKKRNQESSLALLRLGQCCSMHVCRPAVYILVFLSCWISSHGFTPEVHPGHYKHLLSLLCRASAHNHSQNWCSDVPPEPNESTRALCFCFRWIITYTWMNLCLGVKEFCPSYYFSLSARN